MEDKSVIKGVIKTACIVIGIISLMVNILFVIAVKRRHGGYINYVSDEGMETAAALVSVPPGASLGFGTIRVALKEGESAYLQYAVKSGDVQSNWDIAYLYDPLVVDFKKDAFGIKVTAKDVGECVLQAVDIDGISDIAIIQVSSAEMEALR